ncbi:hypothetical protein AXG93_4548s1020 [Marchantia polymorpha subsp. ruderalis]|uniref:Uncharacterized protein n=1 Tax=Marchantia polymorpha subsp. ruderalis TaxID=1480154 RepID=A0A176WB26_MARPO|nr:hypothetical protein AXG93_4548s1020 [Marchantia polymorpha subsp. ruderalis]
MLWTLNYWTIVLGSCVGKDGDFMFEKENVKVTRAKEFTFASLFNNVRSSTNGWRTAEYKDSKRTGQEPHALGVTICACVRIIDALRLVALHLKFLLWNWNCVSATICNEMMDNNRNEGDNLRGNPMLWTLNYWTIVLGSCVGKDGDFMFEKENVKVTRAKEFTFASLFNNVRSSTNGWRTAEYKDSKRCAVV